PNQDRANHITFSPDGTWLATSSHDGPAVHVWDLLAIRRQLAEIGLDWNLPAYRALAREGAARRLRVQVLADGLPSAQDRDTLILEAEELTIAASQNCDASVQDMTAWRRDRWSNDRQLFCNSKKGGFVELELEAPKPGMYLLDMH